ncbi:MAG: MFS transporter [Maricaulaceae bacterium]|jgi:MFS family permease
MAADASTTGESQGLDAQAKRDMRKVALASLAGTSIEWYDFFLYGTAAALIFPNAFFSAETPEGVRLILSFLTFAAGFLARPIGGVIFGHFGDSIGRKRTLVIALVMMGVGSTLIGLLPTYALIGVAAPILLVLLRFIQGLAIGGQWGGAMLLVTENAPANQRGYWGAYAQAGALVGLIIANLAFLGLSNAMSDAAFTSWGWRLPFLASIALIGVSMYIQLKLEDTPAFKALQARAAGHKGEDVMPPGEAFEKVAAEKPKGPSPILEALRLYPGRIGLAAGAFLSIQVTFYIMVAFVIAYGTSADGPGLSRNTVLAAVLIASAIQIPTQFWASAFSDKHGRRGIYMVGAALSGVWAFAVFPLIDTGNFYLITLAILVGFVLLGMQYGPQAAFFTELFSTHVRYSGASLGYQIGAILGGALAPTFAVALWTNFGVMYVAAYMALAAALTVLSVLMLTETKGADLETAS